MHLIRTDDHSDLVGTLPGRVGLDAVWDDLDRRLRRSIAPCLTPHQAWTWEAADRTDERWWPQGVAVAPGGRRSVVSWYAKDGGSRVSFLDLGIRRYRHVELVVPTPDGLRPLAVHAGGLAWRGTRLHVAATRAGLWVCDTDDVVRGPGGDYRLPVRHRLAPSAPLRFSFVSTAGDELVVGEYDGSGGRLASGAADGRLAVHDAGVPRAQGAVLVDGRWYVTASRGPYRPGSLWSGAEGELAERRFAVPMGVEDLAHEPVTDRLWTVTEHPRRRWVLSFHR